MVQTAPGGTGRYNSVGAGTIDLQAGKGRAITSALNMMEAVANKEGKKVCMGVRVPEQILTGKRWAVDEVEWMTYIRARLAKFGPTLSPCKVTAKVKQGQAGASSTTAGPAAADGVAADEFGEPPAKKQWAWAQCLMVRIALLMTMETTHEGLLKARSIVSDGCNRADVDMKTKTSDGWMWITDNVFMAFPKIDPETGQPVKETGWYIEVPDSIKSLFKAYPELNPNVLPTVR